MKRLFSRAPLLGVVIPAWGVEDYLDDCMRSLVAQTHRRWEAVVVDDGATDRTGEIADAWARRDNRISVVHSVNGGLGAARNLGVQHVRGDYLAFLDSDDVLPPTAYADLVGALDDSGSDFATGSIVRWEGDRLVEPPWMRRLHRPVRGARVEDRPEVLGDVFAWNKVFRRSWWDARGLSWPEGVRYEDQPTTTRAFLEGRFDVLDEVVYRWRIREGSITQTRASSLQDLGDRWETKRMSLALVRDHGTAEVEAVFVTGAGRRPLALLPAGARVHARVVAAAAIRRARDLGPTLARAQRPAARPPARRLAGRRHRCADVTALMEWVATLDGPAPRVQDVATGAWRLSVPPSVLDETTVDPAALALRDHEVDVEISICDVTGL